MRVILISLLFIPTLFAKAQDVAYAKQLIDTLCAPQYHGRGYVNNGDLKAAEFIQREAKNIGLQPGNNGAYFQKYSFGVNSFPGAMSVVVNGIELETGRDYIINPNSKSVKGTFKVLYFKAKWAESAKKIETLANDPEMAKTVVVFDPNEKSAAYHKFISDLAKNQLKAAAYIVLTNDKLTWSVGRNEFTTTIIEMSSTALSKPIESIELNIENAFTYSHKTVNVVAEIPGKTDTTIVFTAHYDHLGRIGANTYIPGASDNASGTAMLLDLAKYYLKNPSHYTVQFIWFSGEEAGLLGSTYYVEHPIKPLNQIKFLINLDLMADAKTGITVVNGKVFEDQFAKLSSINAELGLLENVKARGEAANSDHYPFTQKSVPAFFIYTTGDYKHYHDIDDKPENVPMTNYDKVFKLIIEFAREL